MKCFKWYILDDVRREVGSESGECRVVLDEEEDEDPNNCGMHVNDNLNVPDPQGRVLINAGHPDLDEDIFIAPQLAKFIKPHQVGIEG